MISQEKATFSSNKLLLFNLPQNAMKQNSYLQAITNFNIRNLSLKTTYGKEQLASNQVKYPQQNNLGHLEEKYSSLKLNDNLTQYPSYQNNNVSYSNKIIFRDNNKFYSSSTACLKIESYIHIFEKMKNQFNKYFINKDIILIIFFIKEKEKQLDSQNTSITTNDPRKEFSCKSFNSTTLNSQSRNLSGYKTSHFDMLSVSHKNRVNSPVIFEFSHNQAKLSPNYLKRSTNLEEMVAQKRENLNQLKQQAQQYKDQFEKEQVLISSIYNVPILDEQLSKRINQFQQPINYNSKLRPLSPNIQAKFVNFCKICEEQKSFLPFNHVAHKIPVSLMFKESLSMNIQTDEELIFFIQHAFNNPKLYISVK